MRAGELQWLMKIQERARRLWPEVGETKGSESLANFSRLTLNAPTHIICRCGGACCRAV